MNLVEKIDQLLPQTQCEQCGFKGCLPYAESLSKGESNINRCPPGGLPVMRSLAALLNQPEADIDPTCGITQPLHTVYIDETLCIGCTKCIQACPIDAIVGTKKKMHTVIQSECTGCDLCIAPCPLDCIYIKPSEEEHFPEVGLSDLQKARAEKTRARYQARQKRYANRTTITKTLPPQEKVLANRSSDADMLSLIAMAKSKTQAKHQERD